MRSLYIHIPFCVRRCHYCSFPVTTTITEETQDIYITKLLNDFEQVSKYAPWDTIYIGGGTPTLLDHKHWERLLSALAPHLAECRESTVETNPESTTPEILALLHRAGISRISIGVQSMDPTILRRLGRQHTPQDIHHALTNIVAQGFQNISADLILGLPGDHEQSYLHSLQTLLQYPLTHISAYLLMIKEGSAFARTLPELPPEDYTITSYHRVHDYLQTQGFERYEVSNWARPNYHCLHNTYTWRHHEYIGLGMGAESYLQHCRFTQPSTLQEFLASPFPELSPIAPQSQEEEFIEHMLLTLRLPKEGFDVREVKHRFPQYASHLQTVCTELIGEGLLQKQNTRITSTDAGLLMLDYITTALLP